MRAETRITVADYVRLLDEDAYAVLDTNQPPGYRATVAGAFRFAFTRLRRERPAAAQLLELLACLSAEPIALAFLRSSGERLVPPSLSRLLQRDDQLDDAVHLLRRYGLLTTVDGAQRLQVHRLVQLIVRDHLLTEHERERAYRNASLLLVAANPGNPNDQISWEMHKEVSPHVRPARLITYTDRAVRRVVLDQARFLYLSGDFAASLRLAEEALRAWAGPEGAWENEHADDAWDDDETFSCLNAIVTALCSLGRYQEAGVLAERMLNRLNALPEFGPDHTLTAGVVNTVAYARRALGNYTEALQLDQYRIDFCTRRGLRPELQRARSNLAVGLRATGNFRRAHEIDRALFEERRHELGEDHYLTVFSASNLARDLYGLGRYAEALRLQERSLPALRARLGLQHQQVMWANRTVAVCLRKTGRLLEALHHSDNHFRACTDEFGAEHADALAACLTYVNSIRAIATADPDNYANSLPAAYNLSLFAVSAYRRVFNERNPLTLAAATNQAAILRAMGQRNRARITAQTAYHGLEPLGLTHPYTQAAAIGLANDLVTAHEEDDAIRLLQTVTSMTPESRRSHPDILVGEINLALITNSTADEPVRRALDALQRALGSDHPDVLAAKRGARLECDIEPPPF
ncbi:Tetratricopeptide repeat-containing protein [Cryptosporangium aurantiacum]|uniref:Tetratricopeptide repeat-containing protein n=2 Tax=Cryptosporangium aurantiacum TaxID=134849 RepID=A0A1M7R1R3_9ACTN|nr:Tetratricopeptide repeat-containing protein [Cryptosporangium aurantiacum]